MQPHGPEAHYLANLREGRILYQRDTDGQPVFPPRVMARGHGGTVTWAEAKGTGTVYSATRQPRRAPDPPRLILIVEMDEGFRLLSSWLGEELPAIGTKVQAVIDTTGEIPAIRFKPVEDRA